MHLAARREAWHPQGPHHPAPPPRATTCPMTTPPPHDGARGVGGGQGVISQG